MSYSNDEYAQQAAADREKRRQPESLRDLGRKLGEAIGEEFKAALKQSDFALTPAGEAKDGPVGPVTQMATMSGVGMNVRVRVSATVRILDNDWVEVSARLRLYEGGAWLNLTVKDHPMIMARRKSGGREVHELYAIAGLKTLLKQDPTVNVLGLDGSEARTGTQGITEWRYWARLGSRFSVAMQTQEDGSVRVVGIA